MVEKRKLPPRERRESAAKRQAASPPPPLPPPTPPAPSPGPGRPRKKPVPTPASPSLPPPTPPPPPEPFTQAIPDDTLPKKIKDGQPLPIVHDAQPQTLSAKDYQTISESGVLTASLQRSRNKWLAGGIFEKYWTKPSKKNPVAQNPGKETMVKVGPCSLNIEPHHFDVLLYTVREPQAGPPGQPYQYQQRPFLQYGTNNFNQYQHSPAPQPIQPAPHAQPGPPSGQAPSFHPPPQTNAPPTWQLLPQPPPNPPPPQSHPAPPKPSPDPVIQMLATRAASDPELKSLMRVVASSKATQTQLRAFQAHIDELNAVIAQQNASKAVANPPSYNQQMKQPLQANGQVPPATVSHTTAGPTASTVPPRSSPSPYPPYQPQTQPSPHPTHGPPIRAKAPIAAYPPYLPQNQYSISKSEPTGIVFEFLSPANSGFSSSGDRFLFPAYSILDYLPGNTQVVVSFLVVRKGSAIIVSNPGSSFYDAKTEYYQPVTMRLSASKPGILEVLSRVVKAPGEVRKYMEDVMDRGKRAEYVHLATRLPRRDGDEGDVGHDTMDVAAEWEKVEPTKVEVLKEKYEAPSWVTPFQGWGWSWK